MRILLITYNFLQFYNPSSIQARRFFLELAENGHQITVLTNKFLSLANGDTFLSNLTTTQLTAITLTNSATTASLEVVEGFSKLYITTWPNLVNENVYLQLQPSDKISLNNKIINAINRANVLKLGT